jgi:hypothetical protein
VRVAWLLLLFLLAPAIWAEAELSGALDVALKAEAIAVGDVLEVELKLIWEGPQPQGLPIFPIWGESWGQAEVLGHEPVVAVIDQAPRRVYAQKIRLTAWQPGQIELPPQAALVPLDGRQIELRSQPTRFLVRSLLPAQKPGEEATELETRPPAAPADIALTWRRFSAAAGVLTLAALALIWRLSDAIARQPLRPAAADPLTFLPPLDELLRRLDLVDLENAEGAHTAISLALRQYLGRSLGFAALERTTSEIQRALREVVPSAIGHELVALLRECDRVKFGRLAVEHVVSAQRLSQARGLALQIEQRLRPTETTTPHGLKGAAA